jgi:starvation-inducible DNA-binding protein
VKSIPRGFSSVRTPNRRLVRHLHRQIANAFLLYINFKHCQWQTYGPAFRDLHLLFGEFAKEALDSVDRLAERVHVFGDAEPGHFLESIDVASVAMLPRPSTLRDLVEQADRNLHLVLKEMQQTAAMADEHGDPGTVNLASRIAETHRHQETWLRDLLRKREGPGLD